MAPHRRCAAALLAAALLAGGAAGRRSPPNWGDSGYCAQLFDAGQVYHTAHDEPDKWVEAHNHYRRCHGAQDVVWDDNLTAYAKKWVTELLTHCNGVVDMNSYRMVGPPEEHRPHDPQSFYEDPPNAENLAGYDSALPYTPVTQATALTTEATSVEGWYRELETQCPNKGLTPGCGGMVNHYTALMWSSVTRIGCYSGARGNFKVVSCRYAVGPAGSGMPAGCDTPNSISCDAKRVPALSGESCSAWGTGLSVQIPLKGPVGDALAPVFNPEKNRHQETIETFEGDWTIEGVSGVGVTTIVQDGKKLTMTDEGARWSPAVGRVIQSVVTFESPPSLFGVTGTLVDKTHIKMSNGHNLVRKGQPPAVVPEIEPAIVVGLPPVEALPLPDPAKKVLGEVGTEVGGAASGALSSVRGAAGSTQGWMQSRFESKYSADTPRAASSPAPVAVAICGALLVALVVMGVMSYRRRCGREVRQQANDASRRRLIAGLVESPVE